MSGIFRVTRRNFLRQLGVGTGAVVFGCSFSAEDLFGQSLGQKVKTAFDIGLPINDFVYIKPLSGHITIFSFRSEMGQGTKSTLAACLADELEADWDRVTVRQADAEATKFSVPYPYLPPFGPGGPAIVRAEDSQFTDSSRSVAAYYLASRLFGAGIRLVLLKAAAMKWNVDIKELEARQQRVYHAKSGKSIAYEHLLLEAKKVDPNLDTDEIKLYLKPREQWKFIGKETMPFVDAKDMVMGKAIYGADAKPPGPMLTAMIERCPVANGRLKSFDASKALAVPGVKFVERVIPDGFQQGMTGGVGANFIPHDGVAVIAENTWAALQGRRALKPTIVWDLGPNASYDSEAFKKELADSTSKPGKVFRQKGDVDTAPGVDVVEAAYYIPHLAQTPMEPPVATAVYEGGNWEIWTPTQGPELAQHYVGLALLEPDNPVTWLIWNVVELKDMPIDCEKESQKVFNEALAKYLNVDQPTLVKMCTDLKKKIRDHVKIHVTLLGGGFGRKSNPDYVMEAAFLARNHPGIPIRVQWTREDDVKFSFYNAASSQYYKAGLDGSGRPSSFLQRSAFTSFFATIFPPPNPAWPAAINDLFAKAREAFHDGGEYGYGSSIERAQGLEDMPYDIANLRIENTRAENHIRCGWMRSVANIYHAFGLCSFADEMAVAANKDSKDYLLDLIGQGRVFTNAVFKSEGVECFDNNLFPVDRIMVNIGGTDKEVLPPYPPDTRRLRAVAERVAKESDWDNKVKKYKQSKGRGLGIAAHRSFLSYVALVLDVELNDANEITIHEAWMAVDCGMAVNPDRVRAQLEGGINYGLSIALMGEITVKNGAVVQNNFDDYPVLRIHQIPKKTHTYIVEPSAEVKKSLNLKPDEDVSPTGVGEPPTPVVAPALANAIFAAGGPRIREIPFSYKLQVF